MPKYRTLDQHVKYGDKYIEPGTEVDVPDDDVPIWDELVALKVAKKVTKKKKKEEPPEQEQPVPPGAEA